MVKLKGEIKHCGCCLKLYNNLVLVWVHALKKVGWGCNREVSFKLDYTVIKSAQSTQILQKNNLFEIVHN